MHCTSRRLDETRSLRSGALGAMLVVVLGFAASCSDEVRQGASDADAGTSVPSQADGGAPEDASGHVTPPVLEVTCTERPCAIGLSADSLEGSAYCALLDDGRVACWGTDDGSGVLGRSPVGEAPFVGVGRPEPVEGVSDAVAIESTCVLRGDGKVQCWGPSAGTLPFAGVTKLSQGYTSRCAVVGPEEWTCVAGIYAPGPNGEPEGHYPERSLRAPKGAPLGQLFVGDAVARGSGAPADVTFLVREDGTLQSSGARNLIGRPTSLSPVDPHFGEVGLDKVTDLSVGDEVCAIADGTIHCWGSRVARVGADDPLPTPVRLPEPAVRVSTVGHLEGEPRVRRFCAVGASGAVYCNGPNASGQVGDGTRAMAYEPVKLTSLPSPAVKVIATSSSSCALLVTGKVYCWGSGAKGALGNGADDDALTPALVMLP